MGIYPLIIRLKLSHLFSVLAILTLFTIVFRRNWAFFRHHGKKWRKLGKFLNFSLINWLILSIQYGLMDRWPSVRECFYDRLSILSINNKKIFNWWIDNINENESKSIDRHHQYRSIDPWWLCLSMLTFHPSIQCDKIGITIALPAPPPQS